MKETQDLRIGFIGLGKLGGILLSSFLSRGLTTKERVRATVSHPSRARERSEEFGVSVGVENREVAEWADLILLCVKPGQVQRVVEEISAGLDASKILISVAASVRTEFIESALGDDPVPVIRAMPNTPCAVGCGMTALCRGAHATEEQLSLAESFFKAVGLTVTLDEVHFDAVTGLSASGPAFIYIILESLAEAGVKVGLPRDVATLLAAQTAQGASKVVIDTGNHPALLKDAVTTPAGCTIDGIMELEEGKLRVTLIKAVMKATQRAKELVYGG